MTLFHWQCAAVYFALTSCGGLYFVHAWKKSADEWRSLSDQWKERYFESERDVARLMDELTVDKIERERLTALVRILGKGHIE